MPSVEKTSKSDLLGTIDTFLDQKRLKGGPEGEASFLTIIEFIERFKLLPEGLYPVQRFILKLYYNLPLNNVLPESEKDRIKITDKFGEKVLYELTEVDYLRYLYSQGRCNIQEQDGRERRELVLVLGRRSGKCVDEKTLIFTNRGLIPIRDLSRIDKLGWETLAQEVTIAQEGLKKTSSAHKIYNGGEQKTLSFITEAGFRICGTPEHKVKVLSPDGSIHWQKFEDIRNGDLLAIHRGADLWADSYLNIKEFHHQSRLRELVLPDELDERWGRILGILTGDGSWTCKHNVSVTGGCEELLHMLEGIFTELFGDHTVRRKKHRPSTCPLYPWTILSFSRPLRRFLHDLGWNTDAKPSTKHVPWSIMRSPRSVVAAYLSGLFETDGGMEKNGGVISFSTASEQLAREVQLLLLNFGIVSKILPKLNRKYNRYYWRLAVLGYRSRVIFAKEIGFLTDRKNLSLIRGIENGGEGHSDTESVPFQKENLRNLISSLPVSHNNTKGTNFRYRTWLKEACGNCSKPNSLENPSYARLRRVLELGTKFGASTDSLKRIQDVVDPNYFWDPVKSITPGINKVFDLNVPEGESYVANGFMSHNSSLSAIIASYELYKLLCRGYPQAYYGLPAGSEIRVLCIANDKEQASIVYGDISGYVGQVDYFKTSKVNETQTFLRFQTANDKKKFGDGGKATITATFKSSVAKGLRGRGIICAILDELAFFIDDGRSSAERIYTAINPSLAQFSPKDPKNRHRALSQSEGRMIAISSPDAREGYFYRLYQLSMSKGKESSNMLMIQAPTWEVNPTLYKDYYETEFFKNPKAFDTEHGANFSDRVRGWIEDHKDLTDCIVPDLKPIVRGNPKEPFWAGVDFAVVNDGTAIALNRIRNGKIELAYHEVWYAKRRWKECNPHLQEPLIDYAHRLQEESRLDMNKIVEWFKVLSTRFYIVNGVFDQWAGPIFEQELHRQGLKQFNMRKFQTSDSSQAYHNAKMLMFSHKLALYDYPTPSTMNADMSVKMHSPLIAELLELQATSGGKDIVIVEAPQIVGKHDDMSDAYIRSLLLVSEHIRERPGALEQSKNLTNRASPSAIRPMSLAQFQRLRAKMHGPPNRLLTAPPQYRRR